MYLSVKCGPDVANETPVPGYKRGCFVLTGLDTKSDPVDDVSRVIIRNRSAVSSTDAFCSIDEHKGKNRHVILWLDRKTIVV